MYFAAAAMALVSCGKEEIKPVEPETPGLIKVRFGADAPITKALTPDADDLTFTADWIDGDEIGITSFSNGSSIESNLEATWIEDAFYADFDAEKYATEHEYQFKGVFPYSASGTVDFGCVREQTLGSQNGKYDIMVSSTINSALPATESLVLPMARQTATVYFHLKSELDGVVKSATLITEDGKWIAASSATLNHNGFSATGDEKQIKLNILEDDANKMSTKDMQFWFNVLPVSETSLTLLVETETHSFTMSKKSKNTDWKAGHLYSTVIKDIPAEKWAEIERPTGNVTKTLTMTSDNPSSYSTTDGNVTASFDANGGTKFAWSSDDNAVRLYAKGKVTVSAKSGYKLKSVTFNAKVQKNKSGTKPTPKINSVKVDDDNLSWTGEETSVELWADGTAGNIAISSIEVTYSDPNAGTDPIYKYSVMVDPEIENGTVNIDPASAAAGTTVTLTPAPDEGYELLSEDNLEVYNAVVGKEKGKIELTPTEGGKYTFTMPAANVNVTAQFSLIPTLSATSPEPYASNLTDKGGEGFSIPVIANQAWVAAIKTDDPNAADIILMTAEGEGGENNNLVFKFKSQNTSPLAAKSTAVVLSPKNGNRPEPVEITITHDKRGATLVLNNDDKANVTANVTAAETSYTANITNANFSEWSVLEYKIGDVAQSTTDANCVTVHNDGANTGSITIKFPANASESNDVTITLKVGYEGIITRTLTLTQAAAAARTPNVTLDFTDNTNWGFPTSKVVDANTYNDGTTTITLEGTTGNGYSFNETNQYLLLGKSGATLTFQSFDFDVDRIKIYGKAGASASVVQNIFVGETAVSTATTGATDTYTYDINSDYQAAGNVYLLKVTSAHNTQITKIEIFGGASKTVTSVEVSGTPTKTSYEAGEVFNPAGLTVTANYDDGSSRIVASGITWTDGDGNELAGLTTGTTSVTVKAVYKGIPSSPFTVTGLSVTAPAPKTDLDAPSGLTWTESSKTLSWTDLNTSKGTYNTNYKYQYSVNGGSSWLDATSSTAAVLSITSTTTVKVKAVAITTVTHNSSSEVEKSCTITPVAKTTATLTLSSSRKFGTSSGSTLNDDKGNTWTCTGTGIQNSYQSNYSGQQFGTGSTAYTYTFTCTPPDGKTVISVKIKAACGNNNGKYKIEVGSNVWKDFSALSTTSTEYTATGSATGQIKITLQQPQSGTKKAVYLGMIEIIYQ